MRSFSFLLIGVMAAIAGFFAFWQETATAAPPLQAAEDLACILCHQDTTAVITFPSGETIPAQIDLDTLAHSAHGSGDEALTCTDCHNPNDYRSPHTGVTAPDYRSYQLGQSATCERCHSAPHLLGHPQEDAETATSTSSVQAVACIDCHGGHEVAMVDEGETAVNVEICAACHTEAEAKTTDLDELTALIENGLFGQKVDSDYCLACHSQPDLTMTFPNGDVKSVAIDADALHNSVHGDDNSWQPLECANCHEMNAYPHEPVQAESAREYSLERYTVCEQCHDHNYEKALDSVHGAALADGEIEAAVCTDCHGAHDTPVPDEPRERISHTCEQCHSEIFNEYSTSIHGDALLSDSNLDVPTCIECHGVHNINEPTTALARLRSPQLCAGCHTNTKLMGEYDISTEVFDTYVADFHGATVTLFEHQDPTVETNKAVCYDCHGVHNIKATDDPQAGIKNNLLVTCQECHPDATVNFSDAWTSHFQPSLEHNPLVYLVNLFYQIVIPLTVGFFAFLILTDLYRRMREYLQADES
ncbi:MAG: hypothetical protein GY796_31500 [Chloroflexi bacterium]|nr:hypothetical protein [Chloroflexota bacterium]